MRAVIKRTFLTYGIADVSVLGEVMVHSLDLAVPSMIGNLSVGAHVAFELDHYLASGGMMRAKDIAILIHLPGARQHSWSDEHD